MYGQIYNNTYWGYSQENGFGSVYNNINNNG